jgi:quaternary ammonium compound-resistance protein SugE
MAWILILLAGISEIFMALFLKESKGFSQLWPSLGFVVFAALSFGLLSLAIKSLPVGTAYAVWTGIGAAGTAILGIILLGESADLLKLGSIAFIVLGVVGLQLSGSH